MSQTLPYSLQLEKPPSDKLVTPNELEIALELAGLRLIDKRGVIYDLFGDCWRLAHDTDVNYMLTAKRPEAS